jgi:hypothetical protein
LNLAFFLPLETLVSQKSIDTICQGSKQSFLGLFGTSGRCGIIFFFLQFLDVSRVENISGVIDHNLEIGFSLELGHFINSLSQIFPSEHNVLDVL